MRASHCSRLLLSCGGGPGFTFSKERCRHDEAIIQAFTEFLWGKMLVPCTITETTVYAPPESTGPARWSCPSFRRPSRFGHDAASIYILLCSLGFYTSKTVVATAYLIPTFSFSPPFLFIWDFRRPFLCLLRLSMHAFVWVCSRWDGSPSRP